MFAAKSGESDALYILDLRENKTKEIRLELEGIFQPVWNPSNTVNEIAFIGNNGLQSDIYIYNYKSENLINLTDDWFSEEDPSWSIDGKSLYFISNRNKYNFTGSNLRTNDLPESFDFSRKDIYQINNTQWNLH